MSNEQMLECWEREKERLASLGHEWSLEDALRFSIQLAGVWDTLPTEEDAG
jgi:hypothetical protein